MNFIFIKRHHIIRKGEKNNVLSTEGTAIQIIYLSKSKTDVIHKYTLRPKAHIKRLHHQYSKHSELGF